MLFFLFGFVGFLLELELGWLGGIGVLSVVVLRLRSVGWSLGLWIFVFWVEGFYFIFWVMVLLNVDIGIVV